MGVLDTFVFLLETDNSNALKGLNDADHALDDVQDGSKNAHKELINIFTGVGEKAGITTESLKELDIAAIGIAGAGISLNAVLDHTREMLDRIRAAETVGVDIGNYDALSRTFKSLGVEADAFRDSMIDLNEAMGEASSDAKSGKAQSFQAFGVSLKDAKGNIKSTDEALLQLADSMSKMDKKKATFQIKQLGITETDNSIKDLTKSAKGAHEPMLNMFTGVMEKAGLTTASLKGLAVSALGIAGAGLSMNAVLDHTREMLEQIRAAETVGVGIGQYDALSRTFKSLGVDVGGFRDSMIDLNEAMGEAASDAKSGKAESFKTFGVSLKDAKGNIKSTDEALLQLADSMSKMDKKKATFQIKQLGITDNAMITAMLNGRAELERMIKFQREIGVTSEQDSEKLKRFGIAQNELSAIFTRFADILAITVVPALDLLIDTTIAVIKWANQHKGVLVGFFGALAFVAIPALAASLGAMAVAAWGAIAPLLPLIAAAAALALVIDDLWNYFTGGESVIGDLAAQFPILKSVLDGAKESVIGAWEALKLLFSDPSQFMDVLVAELKASWDEIVQGVVDAGDAIGEALGAAWEKISSDTKQVFTDLLNWITNIFSNIGSFISDSVSNAATGAINTVKGWVGMDTKPAGQQNSPGGASMMIPGDNPLLEGAAYAGAANNAIAGAAAAPIIPANPAAVAGAGGKGSVTATQKIENVNIQTGSGDPQQIRTAVSDGMSDHVQQLTNQYDDGRSH